MIRRIRREELQAVARRAGFSIGDAEVDEFHRLSEAMFDLLEPFDLAAPAAIPNVPASREPGRRPAAGEDPCNAVVRWCSVSARDEGRLAGKRIGLKDNVAVAGVPMTCGSRLLDGYVPETDAVIVDRILREGATIVAKLNLENLAWSGGGETSHFGAVRNPFDLARTASGSSGGSGAALFYDGIDVTFGTDQGGSIRLPAAWCGVVGLKPTHGLVPYTGIAGIDHTYDHVGPMARSVADVALALEVVAGKHDADPRQPAEVPAGGYVAAVAEAPDDLAGVRIGVLREGFGFAGPDAPEGTAETEAAVHGVVEELASLGATVREVSVPGHLTGAGMMFAALVEGMTALMVGSANGYHFRGRYAPDLATAFGRGMKAHGDELPPTVKLVSLLGTYLRETYFSALYAKAQNLAPALAGEYDRAFEEVDVLVMPTATHYAHLHLPDASISERVLRGWDMVANTAPLDVTGHPAISIPAAEADGLPVGVQLVGPQFADARLLGLARTVERALGWKPAAPAPLARVPAA